ncbi:hypothetical protein [Laspinema olomoucense]|uniref:hypothetical protein n=1 Tax=Laspinema olomoucense TaxID=3231600 RepID=UPI0021BA59E3|nr:hypothetical protein [Laspinema sp. D3d]MCT7971032.1 hypothetical protein [Laspinema sp. D3d]
MKGFHWTSTAQFWGDRPLGFPGNRRETTSHGDRRFTQKDCGWQQFQEAIGGGQELSEWCNGTHHS